MVMGNRFLTRFILKFIVTLGLSHGKPRMSLTKLSITNYQGLKVIFNFDVVPIATIQMFLMVENWDFYTGTIYREFNLFYRYIGPVFDHQKIKKFGKF